MTRDTSREKDDSSLFCLNDDGRENRGEEKHVKFNITREREREGGREGGGRGPAFVTLSSLRHRRDVSLEVTSSVTLRRDDLEG